MGTVSKKLVDRSTNRIRGLRAYEAVAMDECDVSEAAFISPVIECTPMVLWPKFVPQKCTRSLERISLGLDHIAQSSSHLIGGCCSFCLMGPTRICRRMCGPHTGNALCFNDCEELIVVLGMRCRLWSLRFVNGISVRVTGLSSCSVLTVPECPWPVVSKPSTVLYTITNFS